MAEIIHILNDLIATCRDSEEGFGKAAKATKNVTLRDRFTGVAVQRGNFADELADQVRRLGGEPAGMGHISGIQHRGWADLEARTRGKDDRELVVECATGEEMTLKHFEGALRHDLPAAVRPVIDRQRLAVQEALLDLRTMELLRKAS